MTETQQAPVRRSTRPKPGQPDTSGPAPARDPVGRAGLGVGKSNASGNLSAQETLADAKSVMPKCPVCDDPMERIARTVLMRALIGSKRYYCRFCRQDYLRLLGHFIRL